MCLQNVIHQPEICVLVMVDNRQNCFIVGSFITMLVPILADCLADTVLLDWFMLSSYFFIDC